MSTIIGQLKDATSTEEIFVGDVVSKLSFHLYRVRVGSRYVTCKSSAAVPVGSRVLFIVSNKEYLIVKQAGYQNRHTTEVIING